MCKYKKHCASINPHQSLSIHRTPLHRSVLARRLRFLGDSQLRRGLRCVATCDVLWKERLLQQQQQKDVQLAAQLLVEIEEEEEERESRPPTKGSASKSRRPPTMANEAAARAVAVATYSVGCTLSGRRRRRRRRPNSRICEDDDLEHRRRRRSRQITTPDRIDRTNWALPRRDFVEPATQAMPASVCSEAAATTAVTSPPV